MGNVRIQRASLRCRFDGLRPGRDWLHPRLDYLAGRLADLAEFCAVVDALGRLGSCGATGRGVRSVADDEVELRYRRLLEESQPAVRTLSFEPVLTLDVLPVGDGAARLLTHPDEVEGWAPTTGWYRAKAEYDRACQAYRRLLGEGLHATLAP